MKYLNLFILLSLIFSISACGEDDNNNTSNELPTLTLDCDAFKSSNPDAMHILTNRNDNVDYIIDCDIYVEIDLTIEPGVNIEFADGVGLYIDEAPTEGSIDAVGTSSQPITFNSQTKTKGAWKGIISYSTSVKNRFDFVTISNAGGGSFNSNGDLGSLILWTDAYFRLNNVTINNSATKGLNCNYSRYNLEINNCTITNCEIPIYGNANIASMISGGTFTGNTIDAIVLIGGGNFITTTQTWKNLGVPYRISSSSGDLQIKDGGILTLEEGVIIEFEDGKGISIGPIFDRGDALIAVGTPTNPIIFTGVTKSPGAWKSIYYNYSTSIQNNLSNVIIEYAGGAGTNGAIEMWSADPVVKINNSTFKNISGCAIYDYNSASSPNPNLTESNNTIENVSGGYICSQP